jgi:hypothetical protein
MLKYIEGSGFLPGIPARNLSDEEVAQFGGERKLISSGCYRRPSQPKLYPGGSQNKALTGSKLEVKNDRRS